MNVSKLGWNRFSTLFPREAKADREGRVWLTLRLSLTETTEKRHRRRPRRGTFSLTCQTERHERSKDGWRRDVNQPIENSTEKQKKICSARIDRWTPAGREANWMKIFLTKIFIQIVWSGKHDEDKNGTTFISSVTEEKERRHWRQMSRSQLTQWARTRRDFFVGNDSHGRKN